MRTQLCSLSCNSRKHSLDWDPLQLSASWGKHDRWTSPLSFLCILHISSASRSCFRSVLLRRHEGSHTISSFNRVKIEQYWAPSWIWKMLNSLSWHTSLLYALLSPLFHDRSYNEEMEGFDQDAEFSHKSLGLRYHACDSSLSVEGVASRLKKLYQSMDAHFGVNNLIRSNVTQWCCYNHHQRSVSIGSTFQWGRASSPCSLWGKNTWGWCSLGPYIVLFWPSLKPGAEPSRAQIGQA